MSWITLSRLSFLQGVVAWLITSAARGQVLKTIPAGGPPPPTFQTLKIGGGGVVSGIDIAADGTKICRTDVGGCYLYNTASGLWQQMMTMATMPSGSNAQNTLQGVYEIAIAASNTNVVYMVFNGFVYRTANRGASWALTTKAQDTNANANSNNRSFGAKMAVDPANANIVFVGGSTGLSKSLDGGSTWASVASVPTPSITDSGILVRFDPSSVVTAGATQGIYVSCYGNGVYHSTNGGSTFALTTGSPTAHQSMDVSTDGIVYVVGASGSNLNILTAGTWAAVSTGSGDTPVTVSADPNTAARVVVVGGEGKASISANHGTTWTGWTNYTLTATDVPWITTTNGGSASPFMSTACIKFDPSVSNTLYICFGLGVAVSNPPSTNTTTAWTTVTAGIEEFVVNWIVSPPGGNPIVAVWDQGVFTITNPNTYSATKGPTNNAGNILSMGWGVDYASSSPATIAALCNWSGEETSGVSANKGATWTQFASKTYTAGNRGGSIAASTATNFVLCLTDNGAAANQPYYTLDGGTTWTAITMTGVPTSGNTGWNTNYYLDSQMLCADRVTANTFYTYNFGGSGTGAGTWKTTNGGAAWTRVSTTSIGGTFAGFPHMKAVPGNAGNLFRSSGQGSGAAFQRSIDGGATWSSVANVTEVWAFGFGVAASGQTYPAIYIAGFVSSVWGIYRSIDNATTWQLLVTSPMNSLDLVKTVEGDANTYGKVYVGFAGTGCAYGIFP
jgi:hypothetical protein